MKISTQDKSLRIAIRSGSSPDFDQGCWQKIPFLRPPPLPYSFSLANHHKELSLANHHQGSDDSTKGGNDDGTGGSNERSCVREEEQLDSAWAELCCRVGSGAKWVTGTCWFSSGGVRWLGRGQQQVGQGRPCASWEGRGVRVWEGFAQERNKEVWDQGQNEKVV